MALSGVLQCRFVSALRSADRQRGDRDAPAIENIHRLHEALARLAHQIRIWNKAIIEDEGGGIAGAHAELVFFLGDLKAFSATLDDEGRNAMRAGSAVSDRQHHRRFCKRRVGYKILRAVQQPTAAPPHRRRAHRTGIGAGTRFCEPPRRERIAARQRRQVFLFLFVTRRDVDVAGT